MSKRLKSFISTVALVAAAVLLQDIDSGLSIIKAGFSIAAGMYIAAIIDWNRPK